MWLCIGQFYPRPLIVEHIKKWHIYIKYCVLTFYVSTVLIQMIPHSIGLGEYTNSHSDQNATKTVPFMDYTHTIEQILLRSNIREVIHVKNGKYPREIKSFHDMIVFYFFDTKNSQYTFHSSSSDARCWLSFVSLKAIVYLPLLCWTLYYYCDMTLSQEFYPISLKAVLSLAVRIATASDHRSMTGPSMQYRAILECAFTGNDNGMILGSKLHLFNYVAI